MKGEHTETREPNKMGVHHQICEGQGHVCADLSLSPFTAASSLTKMTMCTCVHCSIP